MISQISLSISPLVPFFSSCSLFSVDCQCHHSLLTQRIIWSISLALSPYFVDFFPFWHQFLLNLFVFFSLMILFNMPKISLFSVFCIVWLWHMWLCLYFFCRLSLWNLSPCYMCCLLISRWFLVDPIQTSISNCGSVPIRNGHSYSPIIFILCQVINIRLYRSIQIQYVSLNRLDPKIQTQHV